ncbi:MAG: hypothetical protein NTZ33_13920 [Bacteroidetes bacterium]|nr:hypothetical protein [Bacteroidota bacterium]
MFNQSYDKLIRDYEKHCQYIANVANCEIHESVEDKDKRVKELEKSYKKWFEYYFPQYAKVTCAWFHIAFAKLIIKYRIIFILLEWYRSAAKSVHADMGVPMYLMVLGELKFMLLLGETDIKAKKLLSGIQAQLQYNKRFINDYGAKYSHGDWGNGDFTTIDGVKFMAIGFGASPRGAREGANRPDYIVVDDVDTKKHVNNNRLMREAIEYITEDVFGCFDSDNNATMRFVLANNNFHKNSITNRLKILFTTFIKKAKEEKTKTPYHILSVTAVKDLTSFEPNWPEKTSAEYWKKKFNNTPLHSFMREFMHKHVDYGKIFKPEWVTYKPALDYSEYKMLLGHADLSYTTQGNSKSQVLIGATDYELHLIEVFCRTCHITEAMDYYFNLVKKLNKNKLAALFYYDATAAQGEIYGDIYQMEAAKHKCYSYPMPEHQTVNKELKIEAVLTSLLFNRRLVIAEHLKGSPDLENGLAQLFGFEKGSGLDDDFPDNLASACNLIQSNIFPEESNFKPIIGKTKRKGF